MYESNSKYLRFFLIIVKTYIWYLNKTHHTYVEPTKFKWKKKIIQIQSESNKISFTQNLCYLHFENINSWNEYWKTTKTLCKYTNRKTKFKSHQIVAGTWTQKLSNWETNLDLLTLSISEQNLWNNNGFTVDVHILLFVLNVFFSFLSSFWFVIQQTSIAINVSWIFEQYSAVL